VFLSLERRITTHKHSDKEVLHYFLAITYSVIASCLWGVHNLTMKFLVTKYHISPREYSFVSTLIDGLIGTICLFVYFFKEVHLYDAHGIEIHMD